MSDRLSPVATPEPRILLGITGGIAAYKGAELARQFVKAGCQVQVVMTEGAAHFITAQTFQALTGRTVRSSLWDEQAEAALAEWQKRETEVVAPYLIPLTDAGNPVQREHVREFVRANGPTIGQTADALSKAFDRPDLFS